MDYKRRNETTAETTPKKLKSPTKSKLSKEQRLVKFAANLAKENTDWEEDMAKAIVYVEKNVGAQIDEEYPLMKFFVQFEKLQEMDKEEQDQMRKSEHGGGPIKTIG